MVGQAHDTGMHPVLDVAIVGAGVSGLYSGWRWLRSPQGRGSRVTVFEMSDRVGGRLLSVAPPGLPQARVELGGMRYISTQTAVANLVAQLGLATEPFMVAEPENVAYLRGRHLRSADLQWPERVPYAIPESDLAGFDIGFTALAATRYLSQVLHRDHVDLKTVDWDAVAREGRLDGVPVRELPMRYVYNRMVSHEAFQFAEDTSGYDSIFFTWNAADGFPWNIGDYGADVQYHRLVDGYESLPKALHRVYTAAGGEVRFGHTVREVDAATLPDGSIGVRLVVEHAGKLQTVLARKAVLAMPRRAIELLAQRGALLGREQPAVHALVRSVTPIPLFKLALCYRERWWETLGIRQGQSVTDLPIRQCYYWPVGESNGPGVILIYNDGLDLDYWAGLRQGSTPYANEHGNDPAQEWAQHPAPARMVAEAHRQLMLMHGLEDRPAWQPYAAAYRDWGDDPFGGGANFWPVGVDSQAVSRAIVQPRPGLPVYVCGEAYSHAQGWVEGALQTAEDMLQRCWGMAPPDAGSSLADGG